MTSDFDVDGSMDLSGTTVCISIRAPYTVRRPGQAVPEPRQREPLGRVRSPRYRFEPDGIGATVIVTAGGKTQRREANGGYKRWAQNDRRLHFGLGQNSTMNVSVRWPSGTVNNYANVPADRLYEAVEGAAALVPIDIGTPPDPPGMRARRRHARLRCGIGPRIVPAGATSAPRGTGTFGRPADAGPSITFAGSLESDQPLTEVVGVGLEVNDVLDPLEDGNTLLSYALAVGAGAEDGYGLTVGPSSGAACFGIGANRSYRARRARAHPLALPFDW